MRNLLLLCVSALAISAAPAPAPAPKVATVAADDVIKPASLKLAADGAAALSANKPAEALDAYEAALAVDPKNRAAYIGMARASQAMGLPGKAVKFYREALQLEPNDLVAIEGQGQALVQRGAKARAQANLDKLKQLCGNCAQVTQLSAAIAKAPAMAQAELPKTPAPDAKN